MVVDFVTKQETAAMLYRNPYFDRMTPMDLEARGASSIPEYRNKYINAIVDFDDKEKKELYKLVMVAKNMLALYAHISSIPWRFAKLSQNIENGYPHTLADIIFVEEGFLKRNMNDRSIVKTLIHEQIHVYQRLFSKQTMQLVNNVWGYQRAGPRNKLKDARNNPDLDEYVYLSSTNPRSFFYIAYASNHPKGINEANIKQTDVYSNKPMAPSETYEHPFERMAYELSEYVYAEQCPDEDLYGWMTKNF